MCLEQMVHFNRHCPDVIGVAGAAAGAAAEAPAATAINFATADW